MHEITAVVFLFSFVSNLFFVTGQATSVDFVHHDTMDGKMCIMAVFTLTVKSEIHCVAKCGQSASCRSVFYTATSTTCTGCDGVFAVGDSLLLTDEPGTQYYRPYAFYGQNCSDNDKPCLEQGNVCFPGLEMCVCDPATHYDPSSGLCLTDCTEYGPTFQLYPLHALIAYDLESELLQDNITACLAYCDSQTWCYGIDYELNIHTCFYNYESAGTMPSAWLQSTSHDSYMRNCL